MPARYILRFTFCVKVSPASSGRYGRPRATAGLEVIPARARPVPFWRHGFLVTVLDLLAVLLRPVAGPCVGLIGDDDWCTSASL